MRSASQRADCILYRGTLCPVLALALYTALIGCRNSDKPSPQARSEATPITAAQAQQTVTPAIPAPTPEGVPTGPTRVTPPASFNSEPLPEHFTITAGAGQFLRVTVNLGAGNDARESVSVQPPGSDSAPLEALYKGGDCWGNFIYALRKTGIYQVEFDSAGRSGSIDFSLLASNDPLIDPGITPGEISIDFGSIAQKGQLAIIPYQTGCDEGDESWPTHLGLDTGHFEFRVMQVAGYEKLFSTDSGGASAMANLEAALSLSSGKNLAAGKMPYIYKDRWGAYIMSARQELLEGDGWRGRRWIAGYGGGDEDYPSSNLGYLFEGISNDGRYFILIRADISHPDQKRLRPRRQILGPPGHTWEASDPKLETPARLMLEKALATDDPASFQPSLNELDAVIRSLKLKR